MEEVKEKVHSSRITNVENILSKLICKKCNNLAIGYIMVCMKCNYKLCNECNIDYISKNKFTFCCPECNSTIPYTPKEISEEEQKQILIKCKYHENGCSASVMISNLQIHEKDCIYMPTECLFCKRNDILLKDREEHKNQCELIVIECKDCQMKMQRRTLLNHILNECLIKLSSCLNCHKPILNQDLQLHKSSCIRNFFRCQTCNIIKSKHKCLLEISKNTLSKVNYIKNSINDHLKDHEVDITQQMNTNLSIETILKSNFYEESEALLQIREELNYNHSEIVKQNINIETSLNNIQNGIIEKVNEANKTIENHNLLIFNKEEQIHQSINKSNEEIISQGLLLEGKIDQVDQKLDSNSEINSNININLEKLIKDFDEFKKEQFKMSKNKKKDLNSLKRSNQLDREEKEKLQKEKESLELNLKNLENLYNDKNNQYQKLEKDVEEKNDAIKKLKEGESQFNEIIKKKNLTLITLEEATKNKNFINQLNDQQIKIKNELNESQWQNKKIESDLKIITDFLNKYTGIKYDNHNMDSYINQIGLNIKNSFNTEIKKYEKEKSDLYIQFAEILNTYNEELPNDVYEMPKIIQRILNNKNIISQNIQQELINIQSKVKEQAKVQNAMDLLNHGIGYQAVEEKEEEIAIPIFKNYDDAYNQIVKGQKLQNEICKFLEKGYDYVFLEKDYNEANKREIILILELVKLSNNIKKITFVNNPNFDIQCGNRYLEVIKKNNSLMTIILYKTNISKNLSIEMLKTLETKPNIKVFVIEKAKIEKKIIDELSSKINLEINNWDSRKIKRMLGKNKNFIRLGLMKLIN